MAIAIEPGKITVKLFGANTLRHLDFEFDLCQPSGCRRELLLNTC
jgi:hypothetical protein